MMRPLGPGMMQQIQQPCSQCNQTGFSAPKSDVCTSCSGKVKSKNSRQISSELSLKSSHIESETGRLSGSSM